ncbi:hypothetical protein Tco_0502387 [Tanacetum coccineum]
MSTRQVWLADDTCQSRIHSGIYGLGIYGGTDKESHDIRVSGYIILISGQWSTEGEIQKSRVKWGYAALSWRGMGRFSRSLLGRQVSRRGGGERHYTLVLVVEGVEVKDEVVAIGVLRDIVMGVYGHRIYTLHVLEWLLTHSEYDSNDKLSTVQCIQYKLQSKTAWEYEHVAQTEHAHSRAEYKLRAGGMRICGSFMSGDIIKGTHVMSTSVENVYVEVYVGTTSWLGSVHSRMQSGWEDEAVMRWSV